MPIFLGDVDIDVPNRDKILEIIEYTPAMRIENGVKKKHNTGIYVQDVDVDYETGFAKDTFDDSNFQKIDIINFSPLERFRSNQQIEQLIDINPNWDLLKNRNFVENTTHIHKWFDTISRKNIDSIEKLAMFLAIIRPSKEYLRNKSWDYIKKNVWKDEGKGYHFKKSHAFGYALTIVAYMNVSNN